MTEKKESNGLPLWIKIILCSCTVAQFILLIITITHLPSTIPIHFNYKSEIDGYGSPWTLLIPGVYILLAASCLFITPRSMRKSSLEKIRRTKAVADLVTTFIIIWLSALLWSIVYIAFKPENVQELIVQSSVSALIFIPLGLFAIVYGNFAPTVPPNKHLGFKTRYAFTSDDAWRHMQRFGGFCFVIGGIFLTTGGIISACTRTTWIGLAGMALFIITAILIPFAYSAVKFHKLRK